MSEALAFTRDGRSLVTARERTDSAPKGSVIEFHDTQSWKLQRLLQMPREVRSMRFSPDGKVLAVEAETRILHRQLFLVDPESGRELREFKEDSASFCTFSPNGHILVGRSSYDLAAWGVATGRTHWEHKSFPEVRRGMSGRYPVVYGGQVNVAFSPSGKTLAVGWWDGRVLQWDAANAKENTTIDSLRPILSVAPSPTGELLTLESVGPARRWELETGKPLGVVRLPEHLNIGTLSPGGRRLAFCREVPQAQVELWDPVIGKKLHSLPVRGSLTSCGDLAFSPDGKQLALREVKGRIQVWDTETGKELAQFATRKEDQFKSVFINGFRPGIAFSPDGSTLALVAQDERKSRIELWNPATGLRLCEYEPSAVDILAIGFSPDGCYLVSANADYTVTLWETATGKPCRRFLVEKALLVMKSMRPGEPRRVIDPLRMLTCLAVSPDGRTLVAAGTDRTIHFWETHTGRKLRDDCIHRGFVKCLTFTSDGRKLVTGSDDGTCLVLSVPARRGPAQRLPSQPDWKELWERLAGEADPAHRAMESLAQAPEQAVAWVRHHLKPDESGRYAQLVAGLDSNRFSVRQKATEELENLGELAEADLCNALKHKPSLELSRRLELLLTRLEKRSPESLLKRRATTLLEVIGSPQARDVLAALAKGTTGTRLTRSARAALERLNRAGPSEEYGSRDAR